MPLGIKLHADRGEAVLIALDGIPVPGDQERFAAVVQAVDEAETRPLYVDCSRLGSLTTELAREVTRLRRSVEDRNGRMTFCGVNVVAYWVLRRCFGSLSLDVSSLPPGLADLVEPVEQTRPPAARREPPLDTARPVGPSVESIHRILHGSSDPAVWTASLEELVRRAGLGSRVQLFRREADRLSLATRAGHVCELDGWLGSLLAAAGRVLDVREVGIEGLTLAEQALLRWSGADLLVPAVAGGRLQGILTIVSGRDGGYQAFRSGEILALTLLGELVGARLDAVLSVSETVPDAVALPEMELVLV